MNGAHVPSAGTRDDVVVLPGRNALLTVKASLWCQMHGIQELAIATLWSNSFEEANKLLLARWGAVLSSMGPQPIRLVRPFGELDKQQVMEIGQAFPLDLTFSCIAPVNELHCGRCNKCAERQASFRWIGQPDPTPYAL